MNRWLNNIQSELFAGLLPPVCVLCGDRGENDAGQLRDLCLACRDALPTVDYQCARCALPLSATHAEALCGRCQTEPPAFERCLSPYIYQSPLDHLLQGLKFNGNLAHARLLGELMAEWLGEVVDVVPDHILPVPLHRGRLRERGFNQALELARPIAKRFGLPLALCAVKRVRETPPQSDLSRKQRLKNIRGAFEVVNPLKGRVVVVDDVMTTGSTADELARALLKSGADSVEVWICARA